MSKAMATHSGVIVSLDHGLPTVTDMAISLQRLPRFAGHSLIPWNVAQHSLLVAQLMRAAQVISLDAELLGLLHDAHESLTSDIPTPWKTDSIRETQTCLDDRLFDSFKLEVPVPQFYQDMIKTADHRALVVEAHNLCHHALYDYLILVEGHAAPSRLTEIVFTNVFHATRGIDAGFLWERRIKEIQDIRDPMWGVE